ncbi:MAG: DUF484 family protein [Thiotrichaceae bacterium]|nr:DUF484 family protein [Thiotrichaceae bacterium]
MSSQINKADVLTLNDEIVANYLKTHPDFFDHQEELLGNLKVPHFSGSGTVSLIERQVVQLRSQKQQVVDQLNSLIQAARKNEQIVGHIQRFTLEMIHTHNIADVVTACQENMNNHFKADFVGIRVLIGDANSAHFLPPKDNALRSFTQLFKNRKPICGQITEKQRLHLFGADNDQVKSAVMMPLQTTDNLGIIALGSKDAGRFYSGMGTLFLSYMAELITASLARHL